MNKQKSILSFWRDLEIFALPDVPEKIPQIDSTKPLPWTLPFEKSEKTTWRHTIYLGRIEKSEIITLIEKVTEAPAQEDWIEKPFGFTCLAVMIVDENGCTSFEGGYLQASFLHGLTCLQKGIPLSRVNESLSMSQQSFKDRHGINPEANSLEELQSDIVQWDDLRKEIQVLNDLGIEGLTCSEKIYVETIRISRKSNPDPTFLNSFYLEDLNQLLTSSKLGSGVNNYLSDEKSIGPKNDILQNHAKFHELLSPTLLSAGRWPSDPAHGLYTAQLAAVNHTINHLTTNNGIIGINGPPGTGKTKLLYDVVASVITNRAKILMNDGIANLFEKGQRIDFKDSYAYWFRSKSKAFENPGIVVASNNNSAVENISRELPAKKSIDIESFPDADYFSQHSSDLLPGEDSWGLLAAAMGNSTNKQAFKNNFWYSFKDEKLRFSSYLYQLYKNPEKIDRTVAFLHKFEQCKNELLLLHKQFDSFEIQATTFFNRVLPYLRDRNTKVFLEKEITSGHSVQKKLESKKIDLDNTFNRLNQNLDSIHQSIQLYQKSKPSFFFFHKLFTTKVFIKWMAPMDQLFREMTNVTVEKIQIEKNLRELENKIQSQKVIITNSKTELSQISKRTESYSDLRQQLHDRYGIHYGNFADDKLYDLFTEDKDAFHRANPWSSPQLNTLRGQIFLKSLKLHEYAILANAQPFYNNIKLFMEMLDGKATVSPELAKTLWNSFFFLVPIVSTSLASVSKLFHGLPQESIGWLLLDEAGQATPQSAVGIISRSKRSIIIGDPLQIEPVVTIPTKLVQILNQPYKNDSIWSPLKSSAQILTDRVTGIGTWMSIGTEEKIWAGLPLRTHRRCNNPMFDIANRIAYDQQMVKGLDDILYHCSLGDSAWFDVQGVNVLNKQVVAEEIQILIELLEKLNKPQEEVFVISPFKAVANACKEVVEDDYPHVRCGTIHTFQGKEANTVFLVLGSDPKRPRSRDWVSQKPNMLNVALTRAKRRFFVIGNKSLWENFPYFDQLASRL